MLVNYINDFLETLSKDKQKVFLERYWYLNTIKDISAKNNLTESNVKIILFRMRKQLKNFLKKRGVEYEK